MLHLQTNDLNALGRIVRANLVNGLSGFKTANLIGTLHANGQPNLAIFSSAVHLGADPALVGFIFRPVEGSRKTSRHSYENILRDKTFTISHINQNIYEAAHQTSANYADDVSEFEAVGLTPQYLFGFPAPFVGEATIKMGCRYVEEHLITANRTILLVAQIETIILPDNCMDAQGNLDLQAAQTVALSGLDTYHSTTLLQRLPYARV